MRAIAILGLVRRLMIHEAAGSQDRDALVKHDQNALVKHADTAMYCLKEQHRDG